MRAKSVAQKHAPLLKIDALPASAGAVRPASIAPTKCGPIIYVDGIRTPNPECP